MKSNAANRAQQQSPVRFQTHVRRLKPRRWAMPLVALLTVLAGGCGGSSGTTDEPVVLEALPDPKSTFAGMTLALIDAERTSTSLHFYDFVTGKIRRLLTGETTDTSFVWLGDDGVLFNRKSPNLNMRFFDPRSLTKVTSPQWATPAAAEGDPHAALTLNDNRILLGLNTAGKLLVIRRSDGSLEKEITVDWDLGGAPLRPSDFLARDGVIWILHQGLDASYTPNGTQAVFALDEATLTGKDLDTNRAGIQGLPLSGSNPSGFFRKASAKPVIISTCWNDDNCRQVIEEFDPTNQSMSVLMDLENRGILGNGNTIEGQHEQVYFAPVSSVDSERKWIARLDVGADSIEEIHSFSASSSGSFALACDTSSGRLWVGGGASDGSGTLHVYEGGGGDPTVVNLPLTPVGAVIVP